MADDNGAHFAGCENVSNAFIVLTSKLQAKIKQSHFAIVKGRCLSRARPGPLKTAIRETHDIDSLFLLLDENGMCSNWMNIQFLEAMAYAVDAASNNSSLTRLVEEYKDAIFSRTLRQVWDAIPSYNQVRSKYYSELQTVFCDKDPDNVTIKEVQTKCKPELKKNLALDIMYIEEGSLKILWLIATSDVYQTFLSLIAVPQEDRNDDYLKVGAWVVYHPHSVLLELRNVNGQCMNQYSIICDNLYLCMIFTAMVSTSSLLIGYYYGWLLRDIDVDQLTDAMCSSGLLTANDKLLIAVSHSSHQKKCMLLEIARHMNEESLPNFCQVVQEVCPQIGLQMNKGTEHLVVLIVLCYRDSPKSDQPPK